MNNNTLAANNTMPQKKRDKSVVLLYAAAVLLLCLGGVFALLWWRRNDRLACRPSPHSHHAPRMENYAKPEPDPNPSSISGHFSGHLSEAGCYRVMPTGCNKTMHETTTPEKLFRDPAGDANANQCATRNAAFNDWCSRKDAEWLYVSKKPKEFEAGCYRVMPTGCNKLLRETTTPKQWFRDPNGDANADQCLTRNAAFNDWCTRNEVVMK